MSKLTGASGLGPKAQETTTLFCETDQLAFLPARNWESWEESDFQAVQSEIGGPGHDRGGPGTMSLLLEKKCERFREKIALLVWASRLSIGWVCW